MGGAPLIMSLSLAANTFSGPPVLALYDDLNGNYIPEENERMSDAEDKLLVTRTDAYSGSKQAPCVRIVVTPFF